jgi:hypothetical protein
VEDIQSRLAAHCCNVSESTILLERNITDVESTCDSRRGIQMRP